MPPGQRSPCDRKSVGHAIYTDALMFTLGSMYHTPIGSGSTHVLPYVARALPKVLFGLCSFFPYVGIANSVDQSLNEQKEATA